MTGIESLIIEAGLLEEAIDPAVSRSIDEGTRPEKRGRIAPVPVPLHHRPLLVAAELFAIAVSNDLGGTIPVRIGIGDGHLHELRLELGLIKTHDVLRALEARASGHPAERLALGEDDRVEAVRGRMIDRERGSIPHIEVLHPQPGHEGFFPDGRAGVGLGERPFIGAEIQVPVGHGGAPQLEFPPVPG